jgi:uncharacterized protein
VPSIIPGDRNMQKLIVSKYLQIVPRKTDYAIYHSLFGNLELIDDDGKNLLDVFKTSNSIDKVVDLFDKYEPSTLFNYINDLQRRNFLVQDGINEYELIEESYNKRKQYLQSGYLIRALQLIVTNKCNFNCEYCFVKSMYDSKERTDLQNRSTNMKMSFDIAKQSVSNLLDLLERNGNRYLNIEFFGGEPLLNWPVIEFILETFKNGDPNGVRIIYSITTNGYLITDKMSRLFKNYGVNVTVSFDSLHKINRSAIENEKGGERVKQNLEILKKNGNYVTFNSVLSKETLSEYDSKALVDIAKYYNIAMIGLVLDLNLEFYENEKNKEKILEELWSTYQYGQSQGIPIVGYWHQIFNQIIGKQPIVILSGYKTCPATGCKLSVEPEGHVFICKCCSGYIGHIDNLEDVICSPKYEEYSMRAYRNAPECNGCEIEGFCSGVCMGSLEKKYHRMDVIEKSSCNIFKGITKKLIQNVSSKEVDTKYLSEISKEKA